MTIAKQFQNDAPSRDELRVNGLIRSQSVRVVGPEGEVMGIMTTRDGLRAAEEAGLDLVEISPQSDPPVCKILDYGKYKYEQQKRRNEARKNQKIIDIKELKFRPNIDDNDYTVKMKRARKFLEEGDKVKVSLRFRGREMVHQDLGVKLIARLQQDLDDIAKVEQAPKLEGQLMIMVMSAK
ncbi:MAG TPA: translation initiation factor IF-3 [Rhodospirillaceae bacterium]|nr:MAG: translation initiation factor IF-3 [Alphaproteobacteria bacterium GWF2_58_20]HAU28571.1 translation initiation factor IF-3 [Rhodospirillaceae bacterium]